MSITSAAAVVRHTASYGRREITEQPREGAFCRWTKASARGCVLAAALAVMAFALIDSVRAVQEVARTAGAGSAAVERYLHRNLAGLELLF
jgi:hypothetical protein